MISEADVRDDSVAAEIHSLSRAAYAVEAEWIGCADFPPLRESIDELKRAGERFLAFRESGRMVGAVSFKHVSGLVAICRLVVHPAEMRKGVGTALLVALHGMHAPDATFVVTTAKANEAAISLYRRRGYAVAGMRAAPEGIELIELIKHAE